MSLPPTGSFRRGGCSCDASPFFSSKAANAEGELGLVLHLATGILLLLFLHENRYCLKKHRNNVPLDSRKPLA